MNSIKRTLSVLFVLALTGCASLGLDNSQGSALSIGGNTPKGTAETFLNAWNAKDINAMYDVISTRSKTIYSPEAFTRFYQNVNEQIGLEAVAYTLGDVAMQGTSAALSYDVSIESGLFGTIDDTGRTMRFVKDGEDWRVAWSTMDIFEGYTADAALTVVGEPVSRANIYDRSGNVMVQQNGTVYAVYVSQNSMADVARCQRLLADLIYTRLNNLYVEAAKYLPDHVYYVGDIDESIAREYAGLLQELCGISEEAGLLLPRQTRQYIGQGAAVHATGYIAPIPAEDVAFWVGRGYQESDLIGQSGVESAYQAALAGRPPRLLQVIESGGTVLRELGRTEGTPPQPVYMTVDRDLQLATGRALAWGYNYASNNWGRPDISDGAAAVVLDVNTGAILAMASYPMFQPGLFSPDSYADNRAQRLADATPAIINRATQERYSPGSIFKIVTTAAIVNEGLVEPDENFFCGLTWDGRERYGDTFSPRLDWRATDGLEATGTIVPSQALTSSCDPFYYEYSAQLYREVSPDAVVRYSEMFGLGGLPGTSVFPEVNSVLPLPDSVEEAINNGIGQGDTQVTAMHAAKMTAAVANGGTVYTPYIVNRVGEQVVGSPTVENTLDITPEVLEVVRQGMCDVTTDLEMGTARYSFADNVVLPGFTACGKTGTSQTSTFPNAWFVAYAPAEDPEIAVVVVAQHSREGSEVAAPMVRRIMDAYFGTQVAPFPEWWEGEYVPLAVPENGVAGG